MVVVVESLVIVLVVVVVKERLIALVGAMVLVVLSLCEEELWNMRNVQRRMGA